MQVSLTSADERCRGSCRFCRPVVSDWPCCLESDSGERELGRCLSARHFHGRSRPTPITTHPHAPSTVSSRLLCPLSRSAMSVPDNPFLDDRTGSGESARVPAPSSSYRPPPSEPSSSPQQGGYSQPVPRITEAPPSPTGSSHSASPLPSGVHSAPANILLREGGRTQPKKTGQRVQFPAELASHISIPVQSPEIQTLEDKGAREQLNKALENHIRLGGDPRSFQAAVQAAGSGGVGGPDLESQPASEGNTRPPSEISEGDYQEIRDQMDIYVDPDERDGLPSVHPEHDARDNQRAALALVRAHTSGRFGFMRNRGKTAQAAARDKAKVEEKEDADEKNDDGTGAFGRKLRDLAPPSDNFDDVPPPAQHGASKSKSKFGSTGGVLSSLLALQSGGSSHTRGQSTASIASSTVVGGSSRASSLRTFGDSDSEEDEEARLKFTRENRMRRGMQAGWIASGGVMTPGGSVVSKDLKKQQQHYRDQQNQQSLSPNASPSGTPHERERTSSNATRRSMETLTATGHQRNQSSLSQFLTNRTSYHESSPTSPGTPPLEDANLSPRAGKKGLPLNPVKGLKKLGAGLGFEMEGSRPGQAKSSGGVFAGLITATGNITGAATPTGSSVCPLSPLAAVRRRWTVADLPHPSLFLFGIRSDRSRRCSTRLPPLSLLWRPDRDSRGLDQDKVSSTQLCRELVRPQLWRKQRHRQSDPVRQRAPQVTLARPSLAYSHEHQASHLLEIAKDPETSTARQIALQPTPHHQRARLPAAHIHQPCQVWPTHVLLR